MSTITYPRILNALIDVDTVNSTSGDLFAYNGSVWANTKILTGSYTIVGAITSTAITASLGFNGDGRDVTNITASNITNFTSDVRKQVSAGTGLSYDQVNGVFSLGSNSGGDVSTGTTVGLTASNESFIACSGSATGSVITVQLPLISTVGNGKNYIIKNVGIGTVNIVSSGSNKIDGQVSASLRTQYSSYSIFGTGSNWWIY